MSIWDDRNSWPAKSAPRQEVLLGDWPWQTRCSRLTHPRATPPGHMFLSDTDELTPTSHWTGFPRCPACRNRHEPEQNRAAVFGCIKQTDEKTNDCLEDNRWDSFQDIQLLMKLKGALSVFVNLCLIDNNNFHQLFTTTDGEHPLCIQDFLLMRSFPSSNNTSSVEEATFRSFLAHTWRNCLSTVWLFLSKALTAL